MVILPNGKFIYYNNNTYYSNNGIPTLIPSQSVVVGYYQGNDRSSRTISLGFTPIGVLVMWRGCVINNYSENDKIYGGLAITNHNVVSKNNKTGLSITTNGFSIYYSESNFIFTNLSSLSYHYIAFK